ncbi:MAG: hypothetical protein HXY35_15370 [Chloroflexi bacterium]|nr:hypothetical protein [Chloroflexota bacterium]
MDPVKILKRSWYILWSYRALWVFGLILALAAGGAASGNGSNNSYQYQQNRPETPHVNLTPQDMQQAYQEFRAELNRRFEQGIPEIDITGRELTTFLWIVGGFVLMMMLVGIVMTVARYVSETSVIRMVDEYEASGTKMTVRQGFRIGWSKTAWRLFLIDLIVNLPAIILVLVLLFAGIGLFFSVVNGTADFAVFGMVSGIVIVFLAIFTVVVLTIVLHLLRNFFWRISALEDVGVRESLRRGFSFVLENWKNVGLMWLVMIGLGIVWAFASIILVIVTIPVVVVTAVIAALISALPYLVFAGIFSAFLGGWLPWAAGALFIAPLFFTIAFSPWLLLGSWQMVYTSTVWTLTYRELKVLPAASVATEVPAAS